MSTEATPQTIENALVDAAGLLAALFPESCRPSRRWLDRQKKAKRIPYIKVGGLIFYSPPMVRRALEESATIKARGMR